MIGAFGFKTGQIDMARTPFGANLNIASTTGEVALIDLDVGNQTEIWNKAILALTTESMKSESILAVDFWLASRLYASRSIATIMMPL
jgi:hypothetical protein